MQTINLADVKTAAQINNVQIIFAQRIFQNIGQEITRDRQTSSFGVNTQLGELHPAKTK